MWVLIFFCPFVWTMVCLYKVGNHLSVGKWESCQKHIRPLGGFSHYSHCSFIFIYYPVGAMSMWCQLEHLLASLTEEESATSGGSSFLFFLFFVLLILLLLLLLTLFIFIIIWMQGGGGDRPALWVWSNAFKNYSCARSQPRPSISVNLDQNL